jgi:fibronectin type 3 domain-containing protein
MKRFTVGMLVFFLILGNFSLTSFAESNQITINTDKIQYQPGDTVSIFGLVNQEGRSISNADVTLRLDIAGSPDQVDQTKSSNSGYFFSLTLPSDAQIGDYTVLVQALGVSNQTTFKVSNDPAPSVPATPSAPTSFSYIATTSSITLSWNAVVGANKYQVSRNGTIIYDGSQTSYIDSALAAGTTYTYELKASNSGGASNPVTLTATTLSNVVTPVPVPIPDPPVTPGPPPITIDPPVVPSAPKELPKPIINFKGVVDVHNVTLRWDASENATSYTLKRNGKTIYDGAALTFVDSGLEAKTSYQYELIAKNETGSSIPVKYTGTTLREVPKAPETFKYTTTTSSVHLTWEPVKDADSFELKRNGKIVYSGSDTVFIDSPLKAGTIYQYELTAVNSTGLSSKVTVSATTQMEKPGTVLHLKAIATESQNTITWGKVAGANQYIVKLGNKMLYTGTKTAFTHRGVKANTSFTYSVTAVNTSGLGKASIITVKTKQIQTITKISTTKTLYKQNETVSITIKVTDKNSKAMASTSIITTITDPQGKSKTYAVKTNKFGTGVLLIKTNKSYKIGNYKIKTSTQFNSKQAHRNSVATLGYRIK